MVTQPDINKAFEYELGFLLTCGETRIGKILALYEAYKLILELPGDIVECGVFKGASFSIWASLRALLDNASARKLIGFDMFSSVPMGDGDYDIALSQSYVDKAGGDCIDRNQLLSFLESKHASRNIELIPGDVCKTVPTFAEENPAARIALLYIDVDFGSPTEAILEHLFPLVVPGGIILFDDYGTFQGETEAADRFIASHKYALRRFSFARHPSYFIKEV